MCLAQGPQRSDAGEAQTPGLSVSSQALYHWSTALPQTCPVNMANFLYHLGFLGPWMYGYATVSYYQIMDHLKFGPAHTAITTDVLKVKNRQT